MVLEDADPEKWKMREHTRVKHELLSKYLDGWIRILGKYNPQLVYFDGFAGRGEYVDGQIGSPIIAMQVAEKYKDYIESFTCIMVEANPDNFQNLKTVVEREKGKYSKAKVSIYNQQFANVIEQQLKQLEQKGLRSYPTFFFLDPFGFSGVPFEMVKKILSVEKTEVFFTFMSRDINRFLESRHHSQPLDQLFGTDEWKNMLNPDAEKRQEALVELYRKQLSKDAGVKYIWAFRVSHTEKREPIYHLIHASNHIKALLLMKGIMYNQGAEGAFTYFGPDEREYGKDQMRLWTFKELEVKKLQEILLQAFKGRKVSFVGIMEETWYLPFIEKHYRLALQELYKKSVVDKIPITSKSKDGLGDKDMVIFPS
ncbi:MAG TPA: three-Cys-motif partner protein TcmP [Nitrososphaerales archaeon]